MAAEQATPAGLVVECDVATGVPHIAAPRSGVEALVLVRFLGEPIGMLYETLPTAGLTPAQLSERILEHFTAELHARFAECGVPWPETLSLDGYIPPRPTSFVTRRSEIGTTGPSITVAICTHHRPDSLRRTLESVVAQRYPRLSVLVIDNAPQDFATRDVVAEFASNPLVRYATEPRKGLSWARNRAVELAETDVIAWVDDDEYCDPWWAYEIARGFVEIPSAGAVTGTVVPSELETSSQLFFEKYSSVRRARGFRRQVFSPATRDEQSPLHPSPPFGIGANMAFRLSALEQIGGFDCALGAGTRTKTGEDTAALSLLLLRGGTIVYQPTAVVHHENRREHEQLRALLLGHGRGLGAYYTSMIAHQPSCLLELLRLAPAAIRHKRATDARRGADFEDALSSDLLRANRIGLLQGPMMYALAKLDERRQRAVPVP